MSKTINKCECCQSDNLTQVFDDSFFNLPVLKCNNCSAHFVKNKNTINLEKYYNETYWNVFRNINNKKITNQKTDGAYLLKKLPRFLQKIIEMTGVRKALAYSQYNYLKPQCVGKNLLEIGSGEGFILELFEKNGFRVHGVEPSKSNIDRINKKLKKGTCVVGFVEDELIFRLKFDVIIISHVLEHVINCRAVLNKLKNKLSDSGVLFIEIPNCGNEKYLQESILTQPHIHHFTKQSMYKLLESLELQIIKIDTLYGEVSTLSDHLKYFLFWIIKKDYFTNAPEKKGKYLRILAQHKKK